MTNAALLPPEAVDALRAGNKIEAIKRVREATGVGLAEAKALVEAYEKGGAAHVPFRPHPHAQVPRPAATGLSPGEVPPSNPWKMVAIVMAIAAIALGVLLLTR